MQKNFCGWYVPAISLEDRVVPYDQPLPVKLKRYRFLTKTLLVMKLTFFLLLTGLLNAQANGVAQSVSLSGKVIPLTKVFTAIEKQTGYVVFYNKGLLENTHPVSFTASHMPLADFLEMILLDQPLSYQISSKTIVIKEKKEAAGTLSAVAGQKEVLELMPPHTITGTVLGEDSKPLSGATVRVKESSAATKTDEEGRFSIQAEAGATLVISYVGYETFEQKIKNTRPVEIQLQISTSALKDMVVTGIFERSSGTYSGSAHKVTKNDIKKVGSQNVLSILSVLDPAVQLPQNILNGSDPNKLGDMRLRGASSLPVSADISDLSISTRRSEKDFYSAYGKQVDNILNAYKENPNLPLFVLDGFEVPMSRINDIDIDQIESITILKDASATAIYGSRGANGVIVVERIKPRPGKFRLGYNANLTMNLPDLHDYKLLNSREKLEVEKLAGVYNSGYPDLDQDLAIIYNERLKEMLRGRNVNWMAFPVRNTLGQRHGITLDGGSDNVLYGIDYTYNKNNGIMKGSDRETHNAGFYLTYRTEKVQLNNQLSLQFVNGDNSPWGSFEQYVRMNPYFTPYDDNGNVLLYLQRPVTGLQNLVYGNVYNPMYNTLLNGKDFTSSRILTNNTALTYYFNGELNVRGRFSITTQNDQNEVFLPADHTVFKVLGTDLLRRGAYTAGYGKKFSYEANFDLNYSKRMGDHQLFATLNMNASENSMENVVVQVEGLPSELTDYIFYGNKYVNDRPGGSESTLRTVGFLGNINYSFNNRYFADFSYRLDGASSLGSDRLFAPFWSIGAGWNLHNEAIMDDLVSSGVVTTFRLRASTGLTGTQQFDPYMAYRTYNYLLNESYIGMVGATLLSIGNERLTWQGTRKSNIGADITLWNDRVSLNGDYYHDFTDKFIADFSLPLSTGFTTYKGNLGSIVSKGWEIRASVQAVKAANYHDFGLTLREHWNQQKYY